MQQIESKLPLQKRFFDLNPEFIGQICEFLEQNQLLKLRLISKQADNTVKLFFKNRLHEIKKQIVNFEEEMEPIMRYVYGELTGELNNEFYTIRQNIINSSFDIITQLNASNHLKCPVALKLYEYLKLLFFNKYDNLRRIQVQEFSEEQLSQLHQVHELQNDVLISPLGQQIYKVLLEIIKLRSMRFMKEWHKLYKFEVLYNQQLQKQHKIEATLTFFRDIQIENQFKDD